MMLCTIGIFFRGLWIPHSSTPLLVPSIRLSRNSATIEFCDSDGPRSWFQHDLWKSMKKNWYKYWKNVAIALKPFCSNAIWLGRLGELNWEPTEFSNKIVVNKHRSSLRYPFFINVVVNRTFYRHFLWD